MLSQPPNTNINNDLGLGSRVAEQSRARFLNRNGTFNVRRIGQKVSEALSPYHALLTISWAKFHLIVAVAYFTVNLFFATAYFLSGPESLRGIESSGAMSRFAESFFFSVQTLATIGYGRISPVGFIANMLVSVEALVGLLGFALATGLLFARFSRPNAKIRFSASAVIAPYKEITAWMFRLVNARTNQMIETKVQVTLSRNEIVNGVTSRKFYGLELERQSVAFMPLHWVVVHPIDEASPLYGVTKEAFDASDPEFLILLSGVDETFSTTVHQRISYKGHETVWNAKFADMYVSMPDGVMTIDTRKLDESVTRRDEG